VFALLVQSDRRKIRLLTLFSLLLPCRYMRIPCKGLLFSLEPRLALGSPFRPVPCVPIRTSLALNLRSCLSESRQNTAPLPRPRITKCILFLHLSFLLLQSPELTSQAQHLERRQIHSPHSGERAILQPGLASIRDARSKPRKPQQEGKEGANGTKKKKKKKKRKKKESGESAKEYDTQQQSRRQHTRRLKYGSDVSQFRKRFYAAHVFVGD
jgi:hypothetical protein